MAKTGGREGESLQGRRLLLDELVGLVDRYLEANEDPATPVQRYLEPSELRARFDLSLPEEGAPIEELLPQVESYLRYSVRTGHPQFHNALWSGFSLPGFFGDLLTGLANTAPYTYEIAPVATLIELRLIEKMNEYLGFAEGEGTFCPGGSHANMLGILCARDRAFPEVKRRGWVAVKRQPALFVSNQAHYSFLKAVGMLGLGVENLVEVRTDKRGRMDPAELEREIERAEARRAVPFFVGATAGTTVLGAFDPLPEIAEICRRHGLWMHVDGAWGGPVVLSARHRHRIRGAERADSFTWDAHKLMGASLTCSALLTRQQGQLARSCSTGGGEPAYLFHDGADPSLDLGRRSLQCGRRADALKLWMIWKHLGDRGLAARVERLFELVDHATEIVRRHPRLELMAEPEFLNLCFRYSPGDGSDPNAVNRRLRERIRRRGEAMVNFAHLGNDLAIRLVISNPAVTESDLQRFFAFFTEAV
jgi:glutamate/tyrosine decarboxylase-like PLP-dependent enzyme